MGYATIPNNGNYGLILSSDINWIGGAYDFYCYQFKPYYCCFLMSGPADVIPGGQCPWGVFPGACDALPAAGWDMLTAGYNGYYAIPNLQSMSTPWSQGDNSLCQNIVENYNSLAQGTGFWLKVPNGTPLTSGNACVICLYGTNITTNVVLGTYDYFDIVEGCEPVSDANGLQTGSTITVTWGGGLGEYFVYRRDYTAGAYSPWYLKAEVNNQNFYVDPGPFNGNDLYEYQIQSLCNGSKEISITVTGSIAWIPPLWPGGFKHPFVRR